MIFFLHVVHLPGIYGQRKTGRFSICGLGGIGWPVKSERIKDYFQMDSNWGIEVRYNVTRMTSVETTFLYQHFECDRDKVFKEISGIYKITKIWDGNLNMSAVSANVIQYFTPEHFFVGFYITLGCGRYWIRYEDFTLRKAGQGMIGSDRLGENESKMGMSGGVGLDMIIGRRLWLFGEGKYHHTFTEGEKTRFITASMGIRISVL